MIDMSDETKIKSNQSDKSIFLLGERSNLQFYVKLNKNFCTFLILSVFTLFDNDFICNI